MSRQGSLGRNFSRLFFVLASGLAWAGSHTSGSLRIGCYGACVASLVGCLIAYVQYLRFKT
jgi:hypothetical protein